MHQQLLEAQEAKGCLPDFLLTEDEKKAEKKKSLEKKARVEKEPKTKQTNGHEAAEEITVVEVVTAATCDTGNIKIRSASDINLVATSDAAPEAITASESETIETETEVNAAPAVSVGPKSASVDPVVEESEARLVALLSTFLHVHPFGVSTADIHGYLQRWNTCCFWSSMFPQAQSKSSTQPGRGHSDEVKFMFEESNYSSFRLRLAYQV